MRYFFFITNKHITMQSMGPRHEFGNSDLVTNMTIASRCDLLITYSIPNENDAGHFLLSMQKLKNTSTRKLGYFSFLYTVR